MLRSGSPGLVRQELAAWAAATEMTRSVARHDGWRIQLHDVGPHHRDGDSLRSGSGDRVPATLGPGVNPR
jgi:hypothetical protein